MPNMNIPSNSTAIPAVAELRSVHAANFVREKGLGNEGNLEVTNFVLSGQFIADAVGERPRSNEEYVGQPFA